MTSWETGKLPGATLLKGDQSLRSSQSHVRKGFRVISPAKEQWQIIHTNSSAKSPTCDCGEEFENMQHLLYSCNLWTEIRRKHFPSFTSSETTPTQ
ncbi:hypothetical protein CDAR_495981 [Caerostris darwini]|uniref:Reverse transcriptase zinc-binding domain-containing protein n=1 Tax=Caerostris darwini TaxID=1538125 RepID=A0AAV4U1S1_9ARAC|nr:hypothetical protein CDAR_495981 [Caerostris darwini]